MGIFGELVYYKRTSSHLLDWSSDMTEESSLLPLVRKFVEYDTVAVAHSLERMAEDEAVQVLFALPVSLAVAPFATCR